MSGLGNRVLTILGAALNMVGRVLSLHIAAVGNILLAVGRRLVWLAHHFEPICRLPMDRPAQAQGVEVLRPRLGPDDRIRLVETIEAERGGDIDELVALLRTLLLYRIPPRVLASVPSYRRPRDQLMALVAELNHRGYAGALLTVCYEILVTESGRRTVQRITSTASVNQDGVGLTSE